MSLLEKLADEQTWLGFYENKRDSGNLTQKELAALYEYITKKRYMPTAETLEFSLPQKKCINKSGSHKKRVIYTFPEDETWILKLLTWLLYKYDCAFHKSCYSFRQNSTARNAMKDVMSVSGINEKWALKLDIRNYFNSMPSEKLAYELSLIVTDDPQLLEFLTRFFTLDKAVCGNDTIAENRGAMAGVPLSAFCANIYLASLDRIFEKVGAPYFRYSDDILVLADSQEKAQEYYEIINEHITSKGLTLNPDKYSLSAPGQPFEFLGFKYHNGGADLADASIRKMKAKIKRKSAKLYRWKSKKHLDGDKAARVMIKVFNRKFFNTDQTRDFSWSRWFFPVLTNDKGLHELDEYMIENIRYLYSGRHYKGNYRITYEHIKELGYKSLVNEFYKFRENVRNK